MHFFLMLLLYIRDIKLNRAKKKKKQPKFKTLCEL